MSEHVRIGRQGAVGRVTLTRPRAINALTRPMITAIDAALVAWAGDPAVECVLVDAEGDRDARLGMPEVAIGLSPDVGIDAYYAGDDAAVVLDRLAAAAEPAAREAAALMATRSSTAVALTLAAFRRARVLPSLEATLAQEYRVVVAGLARADVAEGIRAQVVDEDRRPRWSPARPGDVDPAEVARHFLPRPGDELVL